MARKDLSDISDVAVGSFSAYQSSAQSPGAGGQFGPIGFQTKDWDASGWYNSSTFQFTPLLAGIYRLSAYWSPSTSITAGFVGIYIFKNGNSERQVGWQNSGTNNDIGAFITCLVQANGTTDYFTVLGFTPVACTTRATRGGTYFQGEYVGRFS